MHVRKGAGKIEAHRLLASVQGMLHQCPAHGGGAGISRCSESTHGKSKDYAFEMACSNIRFGPGASKEVGQDLMNMGAKNVCVMVDPNLIPKAPFQAVADSLTRNRVNFKVFDQVRVEPSDESMNVAGEFCRQGNFDAYVAVGGGSTIDTCKVGNLLACDPSADLLKYTNAPIGRGEPINFPLKPLIAVPTTAGTGSETTGVAVYDYVPLKAKVGIASRALKPLLGIVDPTHMKTMPNRVATFSGFDVLCHALESFTAIPYNQRSPCPENPILRPAYQGSNPVSDVWSQHALKIIQKYFVRSVENPDDVEARSQMHLASSYAGIGFGNAGVHLCHGMSYPISGQVKEYRARDYSADHPLIPHGLSVVITAPAVFKFTAPACPNRHLRAAELLGSEKAIRAKESTAGDILSEVILHYMQRLGIENGLSELGFTNEDIPDLVRGTLPQHRVTKLSPKPAEDHLSQLLSDSLKVY
ncbi:unnamed protein product [Darwinula stevensoni]|uniref:Probable hydroxyacid-oxoacid transhydrogenase, mitochondrial n=1 Tax=Darwinula stevensoni TaxID=69355 RepID=A0A7R9ADD1_9CRUS|nr:unnamed protein product [Darwinula stevensoni]CAG0901212.1 unnamed protein product [Darwinula stevensoni]